MSQHPPKPTGDEQGSLEAFHKVDLRTTTETVSSTPCNFLGYSIDNPNDVSVFLLMYDGNSLIRAIRAPIDGLVADMWSYGEQFANLKVAVSTSRTSKSAPASGVNVSIYYEDIA